MWTVFQAFGASGIEQDNVQKPENTGFFGMPERANVRSGIIVAICYEMIRVCAIIRKTKGNTVCLAMQLREINRCLPIVICGAFEDICSGIIPCND